MVIPSLQGNWVDFFIIIFLIFYVVERWGRGAIDLTIDTLIFIGTFLSALKLYPLIARLLVANFSFSQGIAKAMGFLLMGIGMELILSRMSVLIQEKIPKDWDEYPLNRHLSFVPLTVNALIIIAFFLTLVLGLPIQGRIKAAVTESKLGKPLIARTQKIEKTLSGIFGEALSETLNFITVAPRSKEEVKLHFTQDEVSVDETAEKEMLRLVNQERQLRGLKKLTSDPKLRDLARAYARDMFERGYFSHYNPEGESPFERMDKAGIIYLTAGENLALAPSVTIAHQGLMDSPGHRENILNSDFGTVGIGVIDGGIYGKMFVQEFTD